MFRFRPIAILTGIVLIADGLPADPPDQQNPWLSPAGAPLVIAHRGGRGLFPENTVLAFERVSRLGIDAIETDLAMTKDGVLVTHHDPTIDRTSDGAGYIHDYTYRELTGFDFAYDFAGDAGDYPFRGHPKAVPETLVHLFEKYEDLMFVLELKDRGPLGKSAAEEAYKLIKRYSMEERVIVASFSDDVIRHLAEISGESLMLSTPRREATKFILHERFHLGGLYRTRFDAFQVPVTGHVAGIRIDLTTSRLIDLAHKKGMAVHYWTINEPEEMTRIIELGADGIITDRPDTLIDILQERRN